MTYFDLISAFLGRYLNTLYPDETTRPEIHHAFDFTYNNEDVVVLVSRFYDLVERATLQGALTGERIQSIGFAGSNATAVQTLADAVMRCNHPLNGQNNFPSGKGVDGRDYSLIRLFRSDATDRTQATGGRGILRESHVRILVHVALRFTIPAI